MLVAPMPNPPFIVALIAIAAVGLVMVGFGLLLMWTSVRDLRQQKEIIEIMRENRARPISYSQAREFWRERRKKR